MPSKLQEINMAELTVAQEFNVLRNIGEKILHNTVVDGLAMQLEILCIVKCWKMPAVLRLQQYSYKVLFQIGCFTRLADRRLTKIFKYRESFYNKLSPVHIEPL